MKSAVDCSHPYWGDSIQCKERQQSQRPRPNQGQGQRTKQSQNKQQNRLKEDFGNEWINKEVEGKIVEGANVNVIRGRVIDVSKYWLKIAVDGQTLYLNKAYILSIKPAEIESGALGGNNAGGKW